MTNEVFFLLLFSRLALLLPSLYIDGVQDVPPATIVHVRTELLLVSRRLAIITKFFAIILRVTDFSTPFTRRSSTAFFSMAFKSTKVANNCSKQRAVIHVVSKAVILFFSLIPTISTEFYRAISGQMTILSALVAFWSFTEILCVSKKRASRALGLGQNRTIVYVVSNTFGEFYFPSLTKLANWWFWIVFEIFLRWLERSRIRCHLPITSLSFWCLFILGLRNIAGHYK